MCEGYSEIISSFKISKYKKNNNNLKNKSRQAKRIIVELVPGWTGKGKVD